MSGKYQMSLPMDSRFRLPLESLILETSIYSYKMLLFRNFSWFVICAKYIWMNVFPFRLWEPWSNKVSGTPLGHPMGLVLYLEKHGIPKQYRRHIHRIHRSDIKILRYTMVHYRSNLKSTKCIKSRSCYQESDSTLPDSKIRE